MYTKACPSCSGVQTYATKKDRNKAIRANRLCRSCSTKAALDKLKAVSAPPIISIDATQPISVCMSLDCGRMFNPSANKPDAKYCSNYCRQKSSWALGLTLRADVQRDRGEGKTYRKIHGRHEHRLLMERELGRPLLPNEVIHHIDHNKRNNQLSNLRVMTRAAHTRMHNTKNRKCTKKLCENKHYALSLCYNHYKEARKKQ